MDATRQLETSLGESLFDVVSQVFAFETVKSQADNLDTWIDLA